jgi:glycosyl transferase family 25
MALTTFVINLDSSSDRLSEITQHLSDRGIDFTRVPAVDGRQPDHAEADRYDSRSARKIIGREMMGGEIGCFLSHRRALSVFLQTKASHALILEDDAILEPNIIEKIENAVAWLDISASKGWRTINVGRAKLPITTHLCELGEHNLVAAHYAPMGAYALIWSRKGAEEFLTLSEKISAPVDNTMQNWLCRNGGGFAINPELAFVSYAESVIDNTAHGHRPARGRFQRSWLYGPRKQTRLWKNRLWAYIRKAGSSI